MRFIRVYRFIRFLSLDIVLGVASASLLACKVLKLYPPLSYKLLLPLSVWILYLTDHIVDGLRHAKKDPTTRYQKYFNKRRQLIALVFFLTLLALSVLILSFDSITFQFGLIVGIGVLGYFIFQQLRFRGKIHAFPKEPVIAILYTTGIWGIPLLISRENISVEVYISILSFALMVLMNVQLYSILQAEEDKESGYPSLVGTFGVGFVFGLNLAFGVIAAILDLFIIFCPINNEIKKAAIVFLGMDGSLFILTLLFRLSFSKELLGALADASFFIPFAILLFKG